mmetsp:Transcript_14752/g.30341  ORF Transcript_14752/g.30341 Transcript_14752/m.30341 type:complete len:207 (-) Transcript_14752:80-700(-)
MFLPLALTMRSVPSLPSGLNPTSRWVIVHPVPSHSLLPLRSSLTYLLPDSTPPLFLDRRDEDSFEVSLIFTLLLLPLCALHGGRSRRLKRERQVKGPSLFRDSVTWVREGQVEDFDGGGCVVGRWALIEFNVCPYFPSSFETADESGISEPSNLQMNLDSLLEPPSFGMKSLSSTSSSALAGRMVDIIELKAACKFKTFVPLFPLF